MTNDGDFAYRLTQAKFGCEKEYEVELDKPLLARDKKIFESGMMLDGEKLQPVKVIPSGDTKIKLVLKQGVNRQIRRMAEKLGYEVKDLKRTRIGKLKLGDLAAGRYKPIKPHQVF